MFRQQTEDKAVSGDSSDQSIVTHWCGWWRYISRVANAINSITGVSLIVEIYLLIWRHWKSTPSLHNVWPIQGARSLLSETLATRYLAITSSF